MTSGKSNIFWNYKIDFIISCNIFSKTNLKFTGFFVYFRWRPGVTADTLDTIGFSYYSMYITHKFVVLMFYCFSDFTRTKSLLWKRKSDISYDRKGIFSNWNKNRIAILYHPWNILENPLSHLWEIVFTKFEHCQFSTTSCLSRKWRTNIYATCVAWSIPNIFTLQVSSISLYSFLRKWENNV